jgi:hypothetical protein
VSKRPPVIQGGFVDWMHDITEGKRPLPTSDCSRHHYVAQFQLAKFKGKGRLWQLDKEDGTCEVVTPKKAAWRSNLYTVESTTGEHNGVIEGFYAVAEGFAAPALKRFLADPANLSDRDRGDLAFLVAIQEQRTPGFLAEQKETITHAGITFLATQLASLKGPKGKRRKAQEAYEALTVGGVRIIPPDQEVLRLSFTMLAESSQIVNFLPWTLLTATEGMFICSDRPLTMYDQDPPYPFSAPAWASSPVVESTLPLSRDKCLRISPRQHQRIAVQQTVKQVERINRRTYGSATRYVYGPSAEVLEDLYALAQAEPDAIPVPVRKSMVLFEDIETADPLVGDANVARGWPRHVEDPKGSGRMLSYEVLDSEEAARRSVAPRPDATLEGFKAGDMRERRRQGAAAQGRR